MVKEVKRMHKMGRPVLVGTTSVEQSETLAEQLGGEGGAAAGTFACIPISLTILTTLFTRQRSSGIEMG